ncbi:MAG: arylsulfatase, partial [Tannerella sp.]|nr:arylsulfatase [Tannerella sp.]
MDSKLVFLAALGGFPAAASAAGHINFVVINLDDVGYGDFSCNGAYGYRTPNIDRM